MKDKNIAWAIFLLIVLSYWSNISNCKAGSQTRADVYHSYRLQSLYSTIDTSWGGYTRFKGVLDLRPKVLAGAEPFFQIHEDYVIITAMAFGAMLLLIIYLVINIIRRHIAENNLRTLFEAMPDTALVYDDSGRILNCNYASSVKLGYSRQELLNRNVRSIESKDFAGGFFERTEELKRSGDNQIQGQFITKTGRIIDVDINCSVIKYKGSTAFLAVCRDVTEQKRNQKKLLESEKRFKTLFNLAGDAIFIHDMQGRIMEVNDVAVDRLGYSRQQFMEMTPRDFDTAEFGELYEDRANLLYEKGELIFESAHRASDGKVVPVEIYAKIINLKGQDLVMSSCRDLSERKKAQEQLLQSEEKYRTLVENLNEGVWLLDCKAYTTYVNPRMSEILGLSPDEIIGKHLFDFMSEEMVSCASELLDRRQSGMNEEHEFQFLHQGNGETGSVYVNMRCSPLYGTDGEYAGALAAVSDITKAKELEKQREKLMRALELKNKELESIVYVSSHDLRSPLVNIQGFSSEILTSYKRLVEILKETQVPQEMQKELNTIVFKDFPDSIKFVMTSVKKMDILLKGLLKLSRLGRSAVVIDRLNMNMVLKEVVNAMQFQIKDAGAEVEIQDELPGCTGDHSQINQVFSNLIDNALKYRHPDRRPSIKISGKAQGRNSVYEVSDNGIGFEPLHRERVFEIFHRLDPAGKVGGEGLGLTIVRRIIDRHEGDIQVDSTPGEGTTFYITLPAAE